MSLELTRKKKSTFFVQIACYLKEKVQKKVGGSRRATCVIAFREIGTCMFSKIFMSILISCWLTQKRIINIQGKFVFWSLMYWDEKGCLQRWMQCCRLDLTRGGWAGLKGTLLRQLSPKDAKLKLSEQSKSFDSDNPVYCCSQFQQKAFILHTAIKAGSILIIIFFTDLLMKSCSNTECIHRVFWSRITYLPLVYWSWDPGGPETCHN